MPRLDARNAREGGLTRHVGDDQHPAGCEPRDLPADVVYDFGEAVRPPLRLHLIEVHLLADVALPLVHDEIVTWEAVVPDIVQRMLLVGVAVDSPADAARLHPMLFGSEKQAQKAFERVGFTRQNPMYNEYRGLSLKSATYRRGGRGRSWQKTWWIEGDADAACRTLEAALGPLAEWSPHV